MEYSKIIDIHGLIIKCQAESPDLVSKLIRPFKYFQKDEGIPSIEIFVNERNPPYETFPSIKSSFSTPRNIVYANNHNKIIDYFGKGVILENDNRTNFTIFGTDSDFLQEAFYLLILSLFGQYCDKNGLLRIHALALSYNNSAIILSLPPGGGKSTMALSILEEDEFKLISDDEAIFDKSGFIHPFPLRIGILDRNQVKTIPDKYIYKINRMEFGIKYFVDCDYWKDKLEHSALERRILFIGQTMINGEPYIEKTSKRKAIGALIRNAVIGVGLFQGVEFVFNNSTSEILSKFFTGFNRFTLALKFIRTCETYQITFSRDVAKNAKVFKKFVKNLC